MSLLYVQFDQDHPIALPGLTNSTRGAWSVEKDGPCKLGETHDVIDVEETAQWLYFYPLDREGKRRYRVDVPIHSVVFIRRTVDAPAVQVKK